MTTTTSPVYFGDYGDKSQPTLGTVARLIADARTLIQDKIPNYRYDDASLLTALNVTMLEASRQRGDFWGFNVRTQGQVPAFTAVDDTYIELEPQFRLAILHGTVGHALERDQEDYQNALATSFLLMFNAGLTGRALPGPVGGSGPGKQ
jgi:hypothetical protein